MDMKNWELRVRLELESKQISYLRAKITPNASKTGIMSVLDDEEGTVKIAVSAKPEKGKANKELCKFLGKLFECECEVVSGGTSSLKLIKLVISY